MARPRRITAATIASGSGRPRRRSARRRCGAVRGARNARPSSSRPRPQGARSSPASTTLQPSVVDDVSATCSGAARGDKPRPPRARGSARSVEFTRLGRGARPSFRPGRPVLLGPRSRRRWDAPRVGRKLPGLEVRPGASSTVNCARAPPSNVIGRDSAHGSDSARGPRRGRQGRVRSTACLALEVKRIVPIDPQPPPPAAASASAEPRGRVGAGERVWHWGVKTVRRSIHSRAFEDAARRAAASITFRRHAHRPRRPARLHAAVRPAPGGRHWPAPAPTSSSSPPASGSVPCGRQRATPRASGSTPLLADEAHPRPEARCEGA